MAQRNLPAEILLVDKQIALPTVEYKRQMFVKTYAVLFDIGATAKACGVSREVGLKLLQSDEGVKLFKAEIEERKKRLNMDGDAIIAKLNVVAERALAANKFKESVLAYRTIAEMLGVLEGKQAPASINTTGPTQIVFGGAPQNV